MAARYFPASVLLAFLSGVSALPGTAAFEGGKPLGTPYTGPSDIVPVVIAAKPTNAGEPILQSFVSYSIEFAFFPDFAGNKTTPNTFSNNLLNNLQELQGSKPIIRVGGNTQDYALFDANLKTATQGTYFPSISNDYPLNLTFGPSFFESYQTFPDTKFIHGFNLAKTGSVASSSLKLSAPYACKALTQQSFHAWEMGNEPDLYKTSAQGVKRPANWNEQAYVEEWNARIASVKSSLQASCGSAWTDKANFKWRAPSFAGTKNSLNALKTWQVPLNANGHVTQFSSHNYIGGATQLGVTLAGTLMNHTRTVSSVAAHNREQAELKAVGMNLDYILGETNSLYNQGAPGLSNSFGAALWGVDFNLMAAATNIKQVFMHQGTDYRYASWQPISTSKTAIGTKAPYYGNIAVAAALGNMTTGDVRVENIPLAKATESAYAIYANSRLARLMIINMQQYNYSIPKPTVRPATTYNFTLPTSCVEGGALIQRLIANGSDAITGITFNGRSYNYELAKGLPKLMGNVTKDEVVWMASDGGVAVTVPASSAALVQLVC